MLLVLVLVLGMNVGMGVRLESRKRWRGNGTGGSGEWIVVDHHRRKVEHRVTLSLSLKHMVWKRWWGHRSRPSGEATGAERQRGRGDGGNGSLREGTRRRSHSHDLGEGHRRFRRGRMGLGLRQRTHVARGCTRRDLVAVERSHGHGSWRSIMSCHWHELRGFGGGCESCGRGLEGR